MQDELVTLEQSLEAAADQTERAGIKAQVILDKIAALPANQRATYTLDGYTVQLLATPDILRNKQNRPVGVVIRARARDAQGRILPADQFHQVVNPPLRVLDGVDADGNFILRFDPISCLKRWLLDSILSDAKRNGYNPS